MVHWGIEDGLIRNGEYAACGSDSNPGPGRGYDWLGQVPINCPACLRLIRELDGRAKPDRSR